MNKNNLVKCYYCQKIIQNESPESHASVCASVLEPCPNKCGAYVARKDISKHLTVCQNRMNRRSWSSIEGEQYEKFQTLQAQRFRNSQVPIRKYSESAINLVGVGRNKTELVDQNLKDLSANLNQLRYEHAQHVASQRSALQKATMDISNLAKHIKNLADFKNRSQYQLEHYSKTFQHLDANHKESDVKITDLKNEITNLTHAINTQKVAFKGEQLNIRDELEVIRNSLSSLKDTFAQENGVVAALWNEQKQQIERIVQENDVFEKGLAELKDKANNLAFEVRTANELIADCLEKIKKQSVEMQELRNGVAETKMDVEMAEDCVNSLQGLISTAPGFIIWKVTDFTMKLEQAKIQEKVPIKGPMFYTDDYGYRVRMVLYLNGLKKWKGRYLLACLHVIKGDYDDLLKWPCKIEANVTLRDCANYDNPSDYTRFMTAKRESPNDPTEDPHESTTQYIFIPHSVLTKSNYLKNDAFYIQIIIKRQTRNETHI